MTQAELEVEGKAHHSLLTLVICKFHNIMKIFLAIQLY